MGPITCAHLDAGVAEAAAAEQPGMSRRHASVIGVARGSGLVWARRIDRRPQQTSPAKHSSSSQAD